MDVGIACCRDGLSLPFGSYVDEHGVIDDTILYGLPGRALFNVITNDL